MPSGLVIANVYKYNEMSVNNVHGNRIAVSMGVMMRCQIKWKGAKKKKENEGTKT